MLKVSLMILIMLAGAPLASDVAVASRPTSAAAQPRATHRIVRLTPLSGPSRVATLEGVGCTEAICSRVAIRTLRDDEGEHADVLVDFETITAIKPREAGRATVVLTDGTSRQVVIPVDNRVLYLSDDSDRTQKVDVGEFAAIEFLR